MTYEEGFQAGKLFAELELADRIAELEKKCEEIYENGANVIDKCDKKIEELILEINNLQIKYDKLWDEAKGLLNETQND
jgi:hypothetical protein